MALGSARALHGWMGEGVTAARGGVCSAMGGGRAASTRHRELEGRGAGGGREPPAASWDAPTFFFARRYMGRPGAGAAPDGSYNRASGAAFTDMTTLPGRSSSPRTGRSAPSAQRRGRVRGAAAGTSRPRLALIGAAAACLAAAAAVAATAAVDGGEQGAAPQYGQLLPEAHAHAISGLAVDAYAVGPRQVNVVFAPSLPNVDRLLGTPSISDHRARTQTAYHAGGTTHTITLSGPDMPTDATGSVQMHSGGIHFGVRHNHRLPNSFTIAIHDRQAPHLDTRVTPTLDLSAGTFTFRATEPLVAGPGGTTAAHVGLAGLGSLTSADTVSFRGADVTIDLSTATHERLDRDVRAWPSSKTSTTMKFTTVGLRDITTWHDRVHHGHRGYDLDSGRWWLPMAVVRDTVPPVLTRNPQLDFNTGVLTITLSEPVTYFYMPYLFLEDRNGGSRQHVAGASYPSGLDSTVVPITLSAAQLERLSTMYAASGGLRLDMHRGTVRDAANNPLEGVFDRAIDVTADNVRPALDGGRSPSVDLSRQRITVHFAETMDVSRTDASKIYVSNSTAGSEVPLSDGTVSGRDGRAVTVSFPPATKAMIAERGTALRVGADPDAFRDIQGNGNGRIDPVSATYTRDTSRPGIAWHSPALDLGTGLLTIRATDVIDTDRISPRGFSLHLTDSADAHRSTDLPLAGAGVASTGPYAETMELRLTESQRAAAVSASADGIPSAKVGIRGWAYQDYPEHNHGWYVFGAGSAPVAVTADRVPPQLASDPVLNLDDGTVRLEFDEYIDASRIAGSGVAVSVFANGSVLPPAGGALQPAAEQAGGTLVVLDMTDALEDAVYNAHGNGSTFALSVPGSAFYDMSGNALAAVTNRTASATAGQADLELASSVLDLGSGELSLEFNRDISAPAPASLSGIVVAGASDGAGRTDMLGLPVNHTGSGVSISLTAAKKADLVAANMSGSLVLSIGPGVFVDEHHHALDSMTNVTLAVVGDDDLPAIVGSPKLDPFAGRLSIAFDEYIDMDGVDPGQIALYGGGGGGTIVWLTGNTVLSQADGDELVVALEPLQVLQVHHARRASSEGQLLADVNSSAVHDLSGNALEGITGEPVSIGRFEVGGSGGGGGSGASPNQQGGTGPSFSASSPRLGAEPVGGASASFEKIPGGIGGLGPVGGDDGSPAPLYSSHDLLPLDKIPSPIRLDLNTGVLEVHLDTTNAFVDLTGVDLSGIEIHGNGVSVSLEGASLDQTETVWATYAQTLTIALTAAQKAAAVEAGSNALLDISPGTFTGGVNTDSGLSERAIAITSDTTPPSMLPSASSLDLGTGRLVLVFDEHIAAQPAAINPADFDIVSAGGGDAAARVNLDDAMSITAYNSTMEIVLSDLQKALVVGARGGPSSATAGNASVSTAAAGAVRDVAGNALPAVDALSINTLPDGAAPVLALSPLLNLGTGTLTLDFDEYVGATAGVVLAQVSVTAPGGQSMSWQPQSLATTENGTRLQFAFSDVQTAALRQDNASATAPLSLGVAAAAGIVDLSGNSFEAATANLTTVDDVTPPALEPGTLPVLDIGRGTITMRFTEHIEAGGIDISGMAIEDASGAARVHLAGADVKPPVDPSSMFITEEDASLVITLTAAQKGAIASAQLAAGPVRIDAPPSAIADTARFWFAGMSNHPLDIVPDTAPPAVAGPPASLPTLDMARGILSVQFDESIDAGTADPSAFTLSSLPAGAAGSAPTSVLLGAATVLPAREGADATVLELEMTAAQLAAVSGLSGSAGAPPSVNLTMAGGAVRDVSGNAFEASDLGPIAATEDGSSPALAAEPVLDLDAGTVLVQFSEYVNASGVDLSRVSLVGLGAEATLVQLGSGGAGGSAQASAHGPFIESGDGSTRASASVLISLTGEQKALAAHASVSEINIEEGAVDDLSANAFEGIDEALLAVIPDETAPTLAGNGTYLDMGDGVLHAVFDEHVDPATIDPSRIALSISRASANGSAPSITSLAGAEPLRSSLYTADASIQLTAAQRAAVQNAINAAGSEAGDGRAAAIEILVLPGGAVSDLSENRAARSSAAVELRADRSAPALADAAPAVLNLADGTLTLSFDEYVDVSSANATAIAMEDQSEVWRTSLEGASLTEISDSDRIVVLLTPAQRAAAQAANASADGPVRIDIAAAGPAFGDLAGNAFGGASNLNVSTTNDSADPELVGSPALDLDSAEATLTLRFDKRIPAGAADASGMYIQGADGTTGTTSLAGAAVSHRQGTDVVVRLTAAQKASVVESYRATDVPNATLDISPSAVEDQWHNRFAGRAAGPLNVTADTTLPGMIGAPVVDLGAGTVRVSFDEYVRASSVNASALSIMAGGTASALAGAHTLTSVDGLSILLEMTADQKAAAESGYNEAGYLTVSAGASLVSDITGNAFAEAPAANATVHPDSKPPALLQAPPPSIDLGTGRLALEFDEHVDVSEAKPSAVSIVLPPAPSSSGRTAPLPVGLSGAAVVSGADGQRVEIEMTSGQRGLLIAGGAASPGHAGAQLRLGQDFVPDLGGNPTAAVQAVRMDIAADGAAPSLDPEAPPTLDLGSGALRIAFTEQVDPAESDLARLSIAASASADAPRVQLASAHVEPRDGGTVTLTLLLTRDEKGSLLASSQGGGMDEARLYVGTGAFSDLSGNAIEASEEAVSVSPDTTLPLLDRSADPLYNSARSTIEFDFDEYVDAAAADPSKITVRSYASSPPVSIALDASSPVAPAEEGRTGSWHRIAVDLSGTPQADAVADAVAAAGAGAAGSLRIDVERGAFSDLSGNEFAWIGNHTLATADDALAPALVGPPSLDLGSGTLSLRFTEPVLAAPGVLQTSDILIGGPNGSDPVALDRSRVVAQDAGRTGASPLVEVALDVHDLARARALYLDSAGTMTITVPAADIRDRAYNEFAGLDRAHLDVAPDTAGPSLSDSPPVLDMAAGILSVPFDEGIDAARIDPAGITLWLAGGGAAGTTLAGSHAYAVASSGTATVAVVELSHGQKAALAADAEAAEASSNADPRISIAAGSFYDVSGNAAPAVDLARLSVVPDDSPPVVDAAAAPVLDLGGRTLEIHFDEYVHAAASNLALIDVSVIDGSGDGDGRHRIPLDAARIESSGASDGDSDTVRILLTAGQAAALATAVESSALIGFGDPALLVISDGAVADLSGNAIAGPAGGAGTTARLAVIPDGAPPALDPARPPVLDMSAGALTVWLDEHVDAGAADLSRLDLAAANGDSGNLIPTISLAGAAVAGPSLGSHGTDTVVVRLTHAQKAWAAAASAAGAGISLSASAGALYDLSGNAMPATAAASPVRVAALADTAGPQLDGLPVLNLALGTLMFDLDEFADATQVAASGMSVEGADAANSTMLAGAAVSDVPHGADAGLPDTYSDRIIVAPTAAQNASIQAYAQPIRLADLPAGSLSDLAGNGIERLVQVPMVHTNDTSGPALESVKVDLRDGDVMLGFNEDIDAAGAVISHMSLSPLGSDPSSYYLAGADLLLPPGGAQTDRMELRLSGAQKASAALAYAASDGLAFAAPAGAIDDPFGNHAAMLNMTANVTVDNHPPMLLQSGPQAPVLDLGSGVLTLRFDEYVSTAGIDPSAISVRGIEGGAAPPEAVALAGSEVEAGTGALAAASGTYSDMVVVSLSPAAKAAAVQSVGYDSLAARLDIGASASIADPSAVQLAAIANASLLVRPDHAPPHIAAGRTVLDLAAGTLVVALDEHVLPSRADASRITISGTAPGAAAVRLAGATVSPAAGSSDTVTFKLTGAQAAAAAAATLSPASGSGGDPPRHEASLRIDAGAFVDPSGNTFAGAADVRPAMTLPPVSVLGASVESPDTVLVRYTHNLTSSSASSDYSLAIDGAQRAISGVDGSGTASHTVGFGPAAAAPDATGMLDIGRLAGVGSTLYEFAGATGITVSDGQGPSALSAFAVNASALTISFDEAVAGVDPSDFASVTPSAAGGAPTSAVSVAGSGASRLVVLDEEIFAAGAGGTIDGVPAGAYSDAAGNPGSAIDGLPVSAPSGSVRAAGTAPVYLAAGTLVRNVSGASPSIDLSGLGGSFPRTGDFVVSADGLATVTFAAGTAVSGLPSGASPVVSVSAANRTVPDRSVIGAGQLVLVEVGSASADIILDRPARIELAGAAGYEAFWMDAAGTVSLIDRVCTEDSLAAAEAQLGAGEECAIDAGTSKAIYTYHLSIFGAVAPPSTTPQAPGAGTCAPNPSDCLYVAATAATAAPASVGGFAATAGAPAAVSPYDGMLYAAGPATNRSLGESVYVLDPARGHAVVAEIGLQTDPEHPARMRVVAIAPSASSDSPLMRATAMRESSEPPVRELPMILVIDASDRTLARHGAILYTDQAGRTVDDGVPALLAAAGGGASALDGLAYVGMQTMPSGVSAMRLDGGPVLLVNTTGESARVEPMYVPGGPEGVPAFPSPDAGGYYYPREGWQPTAMAADGQTLYMVGAAWQSGPAAEPSSNTFGLLTLSFASNGSASGGDGGQEVTTPRYALAGAVELARLPDAAADNSSFTAAGMAIDPVRSRLYVQYGNGTIASYALESAGGNSPRLPSFLYVVGTAADPRGLALDAATGILYAAAGDSVLVYNASNSRRIAIVEIGPGGAAGLSVSPVVPQGAGAAPVYAIPAVQGEPLRIISAIDGPPLVAAVSAPAGLYGAGSSVPISIAFTQEVVVSGGNPALALNMQRAAGSAPAAALYQGGSGTRTLEFSYTVMAGDVSDDLMYAGTDALSVPAGASIVGAAGDMEDAVLSLPAPGPMGGAAGAVRIDADDPAQAPPPVVVVPPAGAGSPAGQFGFGGGSGGGGGGGGSGGRTGLAVGAGSSLEVSSVSWDCDRGLAWIILGGLPAGASASLPDVSILASSGTTAARVAPGAAAAAGQATYEVDLPEDEVFLVRAVAIDGREAASVSKTVRTGGQCAGEAIFDSGAGSAPLPAVPSAKAAEAGAEPAGDTGMPEAEAEPPSGADAAADAAAGAEGRGQTATEPAPEPEPREEAEAAEAGADAVPAKQDEPQAQPGRDPAQPATAEPAPDDTAAAGDDGGGGGCLVATAAYGTELAPQVQALREVRDTAVMQTGAGSAFMSAFNTAYYAVSPQVADLEREHPILRDAVRALIAPMLYSAQMLSLAEPGSEVDVLAYGAAAIAAMAALYVAAPAAAAVSAARLAPAAAAAVQRRLRG